MLPHGFQTYRSRTHDKLLTTVDEESLNFSLSLSSKWLCDQAVCVSRPHINLVMLLFLATKDYLCSRYGDHIAIILEYGDDKHFFVYCNLCCVSAKGLEKESRSQGLLYITCFIDFLWTKRAIFYRKYFIILSRPEKACVINPLYCI